MDKIETYVFFDIETTGLPWQEKNSTKITELCFLAVLSKDIDNASLTEMPPVCKLTLLFNPQKKIHREVAQMTGLTNDMLRHAPLFKDKLHTIRAFLRDLKQPVCLVAHNGNMFDYKILLAEYEDACTSPPNLLCIDSLIGFRKILSGTNINFNTLREEYNNNTLISDDETDDNDEGWPNMNISTEEWADIDELCSSLSDISYEEQKEIKKPKTKNLKKQKVVNNIFKKKTNKESFKLVDLYERLINKNAVNAHRAEADCVMLLQCVVAVKSLFLEWANNSYKNLSDITPLQRSAKI